MEGRIAELKRKLMESVFDLFKVDRCSDNSLFDMIAIEFGFDKSLDWDLNGNLVSW